MFASSICCDMLPIIGGKTMNTSESIELKSKRNSVFRNNDRVTKCFLNIDDFNVENFIYNKLSGIGLSPKLIETSENCIVTEFIDGCLLFDALEQAMGQTSKLT